MKKLLRLLVACSIRNTDDYYQTSLQSKGIDYTKLTHTQIAVWKATIKVIEADMLIDMAFDLSGKSQVKDVNLDFIPKNK